MRNVGAGLLASAGVVGLTVGIAAKPILGNLLAGVQRALTQPIGRAFVVVAIWDQRRLVVPLQYFIERPFQNWTRTGSDILGAAFLWVDYGMSG